MKRSFCDQREQKTFAFFEKKGRVWEGEKNFFSREKKFFSPSQEPFSLFFHRVFDDFEEAFIEFCRGGAAVAVVGEDRQMFFPGEIVESAEN